MGGSKKSDKSSASIDAANLPSGCSNPKPIAAKSGNTSSRTEKGTLEGIQKEVAAGTYHRDETKVADKLIRNFLARP